MRPPQAATGAHLPPPSTPLRSLVCAVQECKYATRALTPLQVCHCELGGVAASLCTIPIYPSVHPPNPLILLSTTMCIAHPHHYVCLFNNHSNKILIPKYQGLSNWSSQFHASIWTLWVNTCLLAEVEGLGGSVTGKKAHCVALGPPPLPLMPHRHSTREQKHQTFVSLSNLLRPRSSSAPIWDFSSVSQVSDASPASTQEKEANLFCF